MGKRKQTRPEVEKRILGDGVGGLARVRAGVVALVRASNTGAESANHLFSPFRFPREKCRLVNQIDQDLNVAGSWGDPTTKQRMHV